MLATAEQYNEAEALGQPFMKLTFDCTCQDVFDECIKELISYENGCRVTFCSGRIDVHIDD